MQFTPQDWADLQALGLLSVTANSNTDEGRPLQMTTWVDWQGLLKIIGEACWLGDEGLRYCLFSSVRLLCVPAVTTCVHTASRCLDC